MSTAEIAGLKLRRRGSDGGTSGLIELAEPTNDGAFAIGVGEPYAVAVAVEGVAPLLFHRWSVEGNEAKRQAAKNSRARTQDDIETYLYRCPDGTIGIPGTYLKAAVANPQGAAKFRPDPRSPRKSALDLYRAGVVVMNELASLGVREPDYLDRRRVVVQRSGITRTRPAMQPGWRAEFEVTVVLPEYIPPADLHEVVSMAGRLVGVGDFRPAYGRFILTHFQVRREATDGQP